MRERKRLENALATETELVRRSGDIDAYFELAREGETVSTDLRREVDELRKLVEKLETLNEVTEIMDIARCERGQA